jgi:hypothetical protein
MILSEQKSADIFNLSARFIVSYPLVKREPVNIWSRFPSQILPLKFDGHLTFK